MLTEIYLTLEGFYMTMMKNIMLLSQEELMVVRLLEKTINLDFFHLHLLDGVISKEDFFDEVPVLDYLKFRASYGTLGNDNINPQFSLISTFPSYVFNGTITPGSSLGSIPNDDVSLGKSSANECWY